MLEIEAFKAMERYWKYDEIDKSDNWAFELNIQNSRD